MGYLASFLYPPSPCPPWGCIQLTFSLCALFENRSNPTIRSWEITIIQDGRRGRGFTSHTTPQTHNKISLLAFFFFLLTHSQSVSPHSLLPFALSTSLAQSAQYSLMDCPTAAQLLPLMHAPRVGLGPHPSLLSRCSHKVSSATKKLWPCPIPLHPKLMERSHQIYSSPLHKDSFSLWLSLISSDFNSVNDNKLGINSKTSFNLQR